MKRLAQLLLLGALILLPVKVCPGRNSRRSNLHENFQRMECRVCTR